MKSQKYIAVILSISVAILSFSGCSLEKKDATMESQEYSISLPTDMPSVTLAPDDGSIPDLESLEARGSEEQALGNTESKEQDSSAEGSREGIGDVLPTATPRPSNIDESQEGDGPDPTAEPSTGGEGGLPTASPTATPGATASATPTSTPSATQTPSSTPTAQATQSPQQTTTPQATQTPTASATPSQTPTATSTEAPTATQAPQQTEAHVHNWEPRYVASQDYLGNCQFNQHVVVKCYGCGAEEIHDTIAKIHAVTHAESKVLADVPATCTTDGYRDTWSHSWCDCGEIDQEETFHAETPAYGHREGRKNYTGEVKDDGNGNYLNHWETRCTRCDLLFNEGWD